MQRVNLKKGKMKEIGVEHLRKDLSGALEDMPVAITRRGKVVGYLVGDITNLTVESNLTVKPYSSDVNLTVQSRGSETNLTGETTLASNPTVLCHIPLKPRLPSSRKQVIKKLKAEVKAIEKDEFNPLKCAQNAPLPIKPFRAETHHRG